jgi:hypothetical protein
MAGALLAFPQSAPALDGLNLATSEEKAAYATSFDATRRRFEVASIRRTAATFDAERLELRKLAGRVRLGPELIARAELVVNEGRSQWGRLLLDTYLSVGGAFAARVKLGIAGKAAATPSLEDLIAALGPPTDVWTPTIVRYIRQEAGSKIRGITDTTRDQVRETLAEGVQLHETIPQLVKRIDALYLERIIPHRSVVIARTETISASNLGSRAGALATGLPLEHEWLSTSDSRTRRSHVAVDGQRKPLEEPYAVNGSRLMFPGDTSLGARARETILCRCSEGYHVIERAPEPVLVREPARLNLRMDEQPSAKAWKAWRRRLGGRTPERLVRELLGDVADGREWSAIVEVGEGRVTVAADASDGTSLTRVLIRDGRKLVADHEYFRVAEQGQGLAKRVLGSSFDLYEAIRVDRVKLLANIDIGGYAWARFGFTPENLSELERLGSEMIRRLPKMVGLSPAQRRKLAGVVQDAVDRGDFSIVWDVADMRDGTPPLGFRLLQGTEWAGELKLRDRKAMSRLRAYLARGGR